MERIRCTFCKGSGKRGLWPIRWDCADCGGNGYLPKRRSSRSSGDDAPVLASALGVDDSVPDSHQTDRFVPGGGHFGGGGATGHWQNDAPSHHAHSHQPANDSPHHSSAHDSHDSHDSGNSDYGGGDSGGGDSGGGDSGGGDGGGGD